MHLQYSFMSERLILIQLRVIMWQNIKTHQICTFSQFVGHLDVLFFDSNQLYGLGEEGIQLFSAKAEF